MTNSDFRKGLCSVAIKVLTDKEINEQKDFTKKVREIMIGKKYHIQNHIIQPFSLKHPT